jgi:hypothetical protein
MKKIYFSLFLATALSILSFSTFSQSPACANFSGVFISDSLEQNLPEYYVCNGSTFYLKSLNNPVGATYQWKQNGVNISGETNRKLLIQDNGIFSLTMTVGGCTATSSGIVIRISSSLATNSINSNGITQACTGDSISLSAPKGIGFSYQWFKNNALITNALASSYKAFQTGTYKVTVTRGAICMTTMNTLSLNFSNSANPQIITDKSVICQGRKTTLKSSNTNATHTLQWFKDGVSISSANKDSLVVSQTGNYYLQTTKGTCTGNSNAMNISITNLNLPAPQIQKDYSNAFETCANNVVKLRIKDYNDTTVVWLKDGNVLAGQTGTTLIARESGNYAVRYSGNDLCFSQSAVVPVKIIDASTATFSPNNITASSYDFQSFKPTFTGTAPYIYTVNNVRTDIVTDPNAYFFFSNLNAQTLTITKIANACGVGTASGPATITLGSCSTPTQVTSISASNNPVCIGGTTTLNVVAQGTGTLTYQWRKDGVNISNATSNSLTLSNFNYADIAQYSVAVTGGCGTVISNQAVTLNANYGDVVFAKLDYPAYTNSDILLTAFSGSSFGNASNAYRWAGPNGFTSTEQNPVIPNGTALNSGTYTVTATNAGGCVNYALLSVTVTTAPITLGNLGTTSFCPNGTLSVPFTTTLAIGTLYKVYLSDANGSFRNQTEIGNGMTSPIDITFPQYAQAGTKYRIRIVSTSPSATSSLSGYLSTDGQVLTISVKNLVGWELDGYEMCQGTALTGIISGNLSSVTYEWKKDGIFQTTNPSLRMTQTAVYLATVKKAGCSNVSKSLFMPFTPTSFHYTYTVGSGLQCLGDSILVRGSYFSDSSSYQWKRDGNILVNETKTTLIAKQSGEYSLLVNDKCPVREIEVVKITFSNTIENTPLFLFGESSRTFCGSDTFDNLYGGIDSRKINPLTTYSYQWKKNGINIPNATSEYLFITSEGVYSVTLKQGNCIATSKGINYIKVDTVKLNLKVPYPYSDFICQGMQTQLFANNPFNGMNGNLYKDGILYQQTNSVGFISLITETGKYTVSGNSTGCVVLPSDTVKITVGDNLKTKIIQFTQTICNGSYATLGAWYNYLAPINPSFQWFKNNQPIPWANQPYTDFYQSGFYKVRVTSGSCTGFSDSVEVKVVSQLRKPIIYNPNSSLFIEKTDGFICNNNIGILYAMKYGNQENQEIKYDSIFWKRNGQVVAALDGQSAFGITQSGVYTVKAKQGTCTSPESDPVEIKIGEPITANITGSTSIYPGQKAKLNLNFTGGNAWSYQTSDVATGHTTSLSPTLKNVSPTMTQTYSITSVASNCGVGTITGDATVTVLPCPTDKTISLNSGNWNTSATWTCGQIPTAAYDAIIENGHTVTLPNGYQGITKKLDLRGGLKQGVGAGVRVGN